MQLHRNAKLGLSGRLELVHAIEMLASSAAPASSIRVQTRRLPRSISPGDAVKTAREFAVSGHGWRTRKSLRGHVVEERR